MADQVIICPHCKKKIPLTEAISHQIEDKLRKEYEDKESTLREKIDEERQSIEEKARKDSEEAHRLELEDLKSQLDEKIQRLNKAEQQELKLRKRQRDLEEKEKAFELEMHRKLDHERREIEEKAKREFEENHRLKNAEKDKKLTDMTRQIEELKRKAEQGSQQVQGEVLELELERLLKDDFPFDDIEPVAKGVKGGDVIQIVKTKSGRICGKILWESKRTKTWSDSWIQKLKNDRRDAKADIAVIVSETLPKGLHHFREESGIWISDLPSTISLAIALRTILKQVARTKEIQSGKEEKKEVVYNYLTGLEFRNRVQAIMEAFLGIKQNLDSERRAMEKIWAKREKHIERVLMNIAGMHGDLEGIVGTSLPSVKLLELPVGDEDEKEKTKEGK